MYKISQIIHLTNIEKYILVTRENASLFYTRLSHHYKSWKPRKECRAQFPTGQESDGLLQGQVALFISLQAAVWGQPLLQDPWEGRVPRQSIQKEEGSAYIFRPLLCELMLQTERRAEHWQSCPNSDPVFINRDVWYWSPFRFMQLQGVDLLCIWDPVGTYTISKRMSLRHSLRVTSAQDSTGKSEETKKVRQNELTSLIHHPGRWHSRSFPTSPAKVGCANLNTGSSLQSPTWGRGFMPHPFIERCLGRFQKVEGSFLTSAEHAYMLSALENMC